MQVRTKRLLTAVATLGTVAVLATACGGNNDNGGGTAGSGGPPDIPAATAVGAGEGAVNILAWPGYAEKQWVKPFEAQTGCKAKVTYFGTSDEAVALMQNGGYDTVSASGDASLRLIYGGEVAPVNTDLVPNYADIFPDLKDQPWNTVDGVNYGIPHGRGANLLQYNDSVVKPAPTSWAAMFDPSSPYKGKITAYDSPIYIADAAVYLMATQPDLGITNPYALDQTQFDAAINALEQQKPILANYWSDYNKQIQDFVKGDVVLGFSWQVNANYAQADNKAIKVIKPAEGATGWSDTWMIAANAEHPNCAYEWMNYIVSPKANAEVAEFFGEAPANQKSCALTADASHCKTFHASETDYWTNVYYWNTPRAQCLDGRTDVTCVDYPQWVTAWTNLRAS
jgi:putative spermidine/putrescine transport system substrate-binding protein